MRWIVTIFVGVLLVVALPASALHDKPRCEGTVEGYLVTADNTATGDRYIVMVKDWDAASTVEDVFCVVPGKVRVIIQFPPSHDSKTGI